MTSLRAILRRCEAALLATDESPQRAAASLAAGVFLSFSPLLGLQILIAIALAWTLKLNRVLLFIGLLTNLPWLAPPYYAAVTEAAAWVMGVTPPSQLAAGFAHLFSFSVLGGQFWRELLLLVRPLLWPFVIGSFSSAGVLALVAYSAGLALASSRRARRQET
jgi:uncharacterized protein (DUF2062 family)